MYAPYDTQEKNSYFMTTMQFFFQGTEYTNRFELARKYPNLSHNRLQRFLECPEMVKVEYNKKYYFEKESTEAYIEGLCPVKQLPADLIAELEAGSIDLDEYWG